MQIPDLDYIKALLGLGEPDLKSVADLLSQTKENSSITNILEIFDKYGLDSKYRNNDGDLKEMNCTLVFIKYVLYCSREFIKNNDNKLSNIESRCNDILQLLMENER